MGETKLVLSADYGMTWGIIESDVTVPAFLPDDSTESILALVTEKSSSPFSG